MIITIILVTIILILAFYIGLVYGANKTCKKLNNINLDYDEDN